jgi:hypothetical protein
LFKRLLEITSVAVGVIGLALAFYWHAQSVQQRVPTYYVSPERTTIVDTSVPAPSQLQILYKGKNINQNVSAVIVYLWNDGKLPIRADDVLEPIRIQLSPGCEILDVRILKASRAVTKLGIGEVSEKEKNSFPVTFSILEQSDGAALQIIYTGTTQAEVSIGGTIVGAREPHVLSVGSDRFKSRTRKDRVRSERRVAYLGISVALISTAGILGLRIISRARMKSRGAPTIPSGEFALFIVVMGTFLMGMSWYMIHLANEAGLSPGVPSSIWTQTK